jgi:excisionase family DNA binding protein
MVAPISQFHSPDEVPVPETAPQRLMAIRSAAEYLGVSRATVERLVNRGELPVVKVAGSTRYDVEDLDCYIETNRRRIRKRTA